MNDHAPLYSDILNQPAAYEQSLAHHAGDGHGSLQLAAAHMRRCPRLVVVAIGASFSAALPFVYRLAAAGRRVILEDAAEFLHYTYRAYGEEDCFLLISRSGQTIEIDRALDRLRECGGTIIGLTNVPDSRLAREADVTLWLNSPADVMIAIQTYLTTVLTLHLLAELTVSDRPANAILAEAAALEPSLRETVITYAALSPNWVRDFRPYHAVYFLGRGASFGTATQGALLMHEMVRFPGVAAYSGGHFRHGPWEVADERIRTIVFAPSDQTADLNIALAKDVHEMGSSVTLVTSLPSQKGAEGLDKWMLPAVAPQLAPLLEIVPVQFFTYEFARWQGLVPGEFRVCTPITLTEGVA
jgi:glucosamine--fructose-6-phosphate aminotransferase (isomerizing)